MRKGVTLIELLLVVGVLAILAGSSAPYMVRTMSWFSDIAESESSVHELYNSGMIVSRAVTNTRNAIASFTISDGVFSYAGKVVQEGVEVAWNAAGPNGTVIFRISTIGASPETLRFVILPEH